MSWSVNKKVGKPEAVRPVVEKEFDVAAKMYAGKTEEKDVLGAKAAVLAWLDEVRCTESEGVEVEANGSRGDAWVSVTIKCNKIALLLV